MKRTVQTPRAKWEETVKGQGLVYPMTDRPDGTQTPYWFESAAYVLDGWEVDHIESVTADLEQMCREAARFLVTGEFGDLGLSPQALELAAKSLESDPVSIYGRFDLRYDGQGPAQLYEYNADTPTGLIEASIAQWYWLQERYPERDQFNSLHERLVAAWAAERSRVGHVLHVAHSDVDTSGEEFMTAAYMRECATQAGINTVGITMEQILWNYQSQDFEDNEGRPIRALFKLYPTEDLLSDDFGEHILANPSVMRVIEPYWKVVLSNKTLLAALWHLFPGHDYLIPAYLDKPWGMDATGWIEKPLHGREGDGMKWTVNGVQSQSPSQEYGEEGYCYQQWAPPGVFDGNSVVIGSWVVAGHPAGIGIRESDGPITDYYARFVPHYIDAPSPDSKQRAAWLKEDGVK